MDHQPDRSCDLAPLFLRCNQNLSRSEPCVSDGAIFRHTIRGRIFMDRPPENAGSARSWSAFHYRRNRFRNCRRNLSLKPIFRRRTLRLPRSTRAGFIFWNPPFPRPTRSSPILLRSRRLRTPLRIYRNSSYRGWRSRIDRWIRLSGRTDFFDRILPALSGRRSIGLSCSPFPRTKCPTRFLFRPKTDTALGQTGKNRCRNGDIFNDRRIFSGSRGRPNRRPDHRDPVNDLLTLSRADLEKTAESS